MKKPLLIALALTAFLTGEYVTTAQAQRSTHASGNLAPGQSGRINRGHAPANAYPGYYQQQGYYYGPTGGSYQNGGLYQTGPYYRSW
jgi:hypothetical protein